MSGPPRVSVVMNLHNGAAYVREALASALAQSFSNLEIVVWDDRSTDGSDRIVASFEDPRIRYFLAPEKTSLGRARDLASSHARGEWIAFLDQDDLWLPHKLASQLRRSESLPEAGLVYGRTLAFDERGRERDFDHRHELRPLPEGDIFRDLFTDSCFIAMSSAMFRREALDAARPIPAEIEVTPDYYLYLEVARNNPVAAVQEVVSRCRLHASSMSGLTRLRMHHEALWLVARWEKEIAPGLARRRRRIHHTLVALEEMRALDTFGIGLGRLFTRGSLAFLLSRPPARSLRWLRRRVFRPEHGTSALELSRPERSPVLLTPVNATSFDAAVEFLAGLVSRRTSGYVSPANVYSVMLARDRPEYRELLSRASFVTADGMPIVWALRALGRAAERVHNDDLFFACGERFPGWRHFLVGGRAGQAEAAAEVLRRRFPGITVVGAHATPVRPVPPSETDLILKEIREADATIVWVGMGTPAQDVWMAAATPRADVPMVGVGSLFDLLTGVSRPAPASMKRSGLQWLFRLWHEPRRLGFRYLYYNPRFVLAFARQLAERACARPSAGAERERAT